MLILVVSRIDVENNDRALKNLLTREVSSEWTIDKTERILNQQMQLIDLTSSIVLFALGSLLEFTKRIDIVLCGATLFAAFSHAILLFPLKAFYMNEFPLIGLELFQVFPPNFVFALTSTVFFLQTIYLARWQPRFELPLLYAVVFLLTAFGQNIEIFLPDEMDPE